MMEMDMLWNCFSSAPDENYESWNDVDVAQGVNWTAYRHLRIERRA